MSRGSKSKIVLLTGNSLCHNPRAMKEAAALARAGHEVSVLGAWHDPSFKTRDLRLMETIPFQFIPVLDCTRSGPHHQAARFIRRAGRKTANLCYGATGLQSRWQLGLGIGRLLRQALRSRADLYIAHSEPALHVGGALLRRGMRVGVDMEDWFSEDLLPEARQHRPVRLLRIMERELLVRGAYAACPSHALSAALAGAYGCRPPTVIYNAFEWAGRQALGGVTNDRRDRSIPSIHWYSTTLGPGRGLEDLVAAIPFLKHDMEIHFRGSPADGFDGWIRSHVPEHRRAKVFFHPLVTNDQLLSRIAEHDIGFAGEMNDCRSRDLTVTNKILHYLLGGLAVVASDTVGQREVASRAPEAVRLYPPGQPRALAAALDEFLASPERLQSAKAAALMAAQKTFCWERQEPALLDAVARALERGPAETRVPDARAIAAEFGSESAPRATRRDLQ